MSNFMQCICTENSTFIIVVEKGRRIKKDFRRSQGTLYNITDK